MDTTINKTEYRSKRNPTGKPRWIRQTKLPTVIGLTTKHAVCCNKINYLLHEGAFALCVL